MSEGARAVVSLALIPISAVIRGWAIRLTWLWFVVPVTGLMPISAAAGYGLAIFLGAISLSTVDLQASKKSADERTSIQEFLLGTITMLMLVGIGWIVKTWWL